MRTPLTLVTGFLGSGKTTLLRKILADTSHKVAIVMNEFGEIAIDAKVMRGRNVEIAELGGGCVCCSLLGEFEVAIQEIIARVHPDAIVVETTGLAEPEALVFNIEESLPHLVRLDGVVSLADADAIVRFPQIGRTTRMQLEMADILLVNKCDLVDAKELENVTAKLKKINPHAHFFYTVQSNFDTSLLFGLSVERGAKDSSRVRTSPVAGEEHQLAFSMFAVTCDGVAEREHFGNFADALPSTVYRAKGLVKLTDGGHHFNYVAKRWNLEACSVEKNEFVFIGRNVESVQTEIEKNISSLFQ
jgi:G3E family GTPase